MASKKAKNTTIKSPVVEHVGWGRGRRMEEDGGGCGDDDNNACGVYNDRANENATKALPEGGVQDGGNFQTQSTIKLELGMERGGRMCKNDDDYNDETRRKNT